MGELVAEARQLRRGPTRKEKKRIDVAAVIRPPHAIWVDAPHPSTGYAGTGPMWSRLDVGGPAYGEETNCGVAFSNQESHQNENIALVPVSWPRFQLTFLVIANDTLFIHSFILSIGE
jgi:hypothetical protein